MRTALNYLAIAALYESALAFPSLGLDALQTLQRSAPLNFDHIARRSTGNVTSPGFNAQQQYVSTSGEHEFIAPGPGDARGPCPGLNAMANHNYIPRNGVANIAQFIEGTLAVFGMAEDLSGFLAVYGSIFDGDLTAWSIGGPSNALPPVTGLLGTPQGISGSHNKYENDASPIRGDLYTQGNDYKNQMSAFEQFYNYEAGKADEDVNYDLDIIKEHRNNRFTASIENNPYFFNGPFSGVIASPAAYVFIYRFMANKSEEYPEGRLDREVLKSFYAVSGEPGSFSYKPGWERIPENWYKRAIGDEYSIPFLAADSFEQDITYPQFVSVGGNLGKKNSFTGLDPVDLSGGLYNLATLLSHPSAAMCFGFMLGLEAAPDLLEGLFTDVTPAMNILTKAFVAAGKAVSCPPIENKQYNQFKRYQNYPGFSKSYKGYSGL